MTEINYCELRGQIRVFKSGRSQESDQAWCRASIKVGKRYFPLKAFGEAAEALGNAADLVVTVSGHLEGDKPKDASVKNWPLVVVVEKVREHVEEQGNAPKAQEDSVPF